MFRTVYFYISLWICLFLTLPALGAVEILRLFSKSGSEKLAEKVARLWGRSLLFFSGSRVEVLGMEHIPKEGPVIFISNHQSNFDIPLILGHFNRPMGFLSKIEMRSVPIVGRWMTHLHCVFMDRSNPRESLKAIGKAAETVKEGHALCIFPEGTRSGSGTVEEFKSGAFKIQTKSEAPVLPIAIEGTFRIQGKDSWRVNPSRVTVSILELMDFKEFSPRDTAAMAEALREKIGDELKRLNGETS